MKKLIYYFLVVFFVSSCLEAEQSSYELVIASGQLANKASDKLPEAIQDLLYPQFEKECSEFAYRSEVLIIHRVDLEDTDSTVFEFKPSKMQSILGVSELGKEDISSVLKNDIKIGEALAMGEGNNFHLAKLSRIMNDFDQGHIFELQTNENTGSALGDSTIIPLYTSTEELNTAILEIQCSSGGNPSSILVLYNLEPFKQTSNQDPLEMALTDMLNIVANREGQTKDRKNMATEIIEKYVNEGAKILEVAEPGGIPLNGGEEGFPLIADWLDDISAFRTIEGVELVDVKKNAANGKIDEIIAIEHHMGN